MALYFTGEIVGVKRKAPEVITMVNGYPHVTYPAFDIVGKILWVSLSKDKYEVKVNNNNCILRVSDRDIFKIDYAGESEVFDSILLNDPLSQPYIYLGEFADHVLNKKGKAFGFGGGFTQLSKKELKYAEADTKAAKEAYVMFNKTPKYSVNDIVIIDKDSFDVCGHDVVGVIKDVFNHRDTGEVFYHIIFNSGTPGKFFEYEVETKFNTDKFKDGQSIYKQLLVKMYHTRDHKYLSENEVLAWAYANFEVYVEENIGSELNSLCTAYVNASKYSYRYDPKYLERSLKNLQQNSLYGMYPEYFPGYHFTPARRPLKALEELNKREFERVAAEPIRFNIDEFKLPTKEEIKKMINKDFGVSGTYTWNLYKKIIFSGPCTIILWKDGTKTIAKTSGGEAFDPEKGVAICFMKKMLGHTETNKVLRKAHKQYEDYIAENKIYPTFDEFIEYLGSLKSKTKSVDQSTIDEVKKVEEDQDESK